MNKKILLYAITTLFVFSVVNVFSSEANIPVWLSDFDILYNGEKIEFKDADGNACDSFIYNGVTYVPLRSMAETMGKQIYWNQGDKRVSVEDEPVIKQVTIKRNAYIVTAELYNEADGKIIKAVEESSEPLKISSDSAYEIELDYFEPAPGIAVEANENCKVKTFYEKEGERCSIEVLNVNGLKIAEYKINFKRRCFGEYIKDFTISDIPVEKIYKITSKRKYETEAGNGVKVDCYNNADGSWSTIAFVYNYEGIGKKIAYDSPLMANDKKVFQIAREYPTYSVYAVKNNIEEKLFFEIGDGYGGRTEYTFLDGNKTEHTIIIDYFEPIPYLIGDNVIQVPSYQNPVAKIEVLSDDGKSFITHTVKFKRRKFSESLSSRNIDVESVRDADEIYTNSNCFWSSGKILSCVKDKEGIWSAYTTMFGKYYSIDAPNI